jgi:ribonucleoside-triphosphate reductase
MATSLAFKDTSNPEYSNFIALSRYSRWKPELNRRETFEESVDRYFSFFEARYPWLKTDPDWALARQEYLSLGVVGSMRALMTAGEALERDNVAAYNCAFTAIEGVGETLTFEHEKLDEPVTIRISSPIDFDESMYILMCGTGVGFSAERQYIANLPKVGKKLNRRVYLPNNKNYPGVPKDEISLFDKKTNIIKVHDSKYGWASALRILIVELFNGNFNVKWDTSDIRPAGEKLKVFGGRASGPGPLEDLFAFCVASIKGADGRKLQSVEVHDIMCKIADIVVCGGVRRSALISLSNLTDDRMRHAKSGEWWKENPQRGLANNSIAYTEKPDMQAFMREWLALAESGSGERGIFYRKAAQDLIPERRKLFGYKEFGCNPCSEIVLRSKQFCNLSEVIARSTDTPEDLERKVKAATVLGSVQATVTKFRYLSPEWQMNTEEEALLGVSITGIMDNALLNGSTYGDELDQLLTHLKEVAVDTNKIWAEKLGINQASAITCVKPSGTVSQLVDSASGIHPRYSEYYIRTVRADKKDPLAKFMVDAGFPVEDDVTKPDSGYVFSFPIKAPYGSVMRDDVSAINQLELWKTYQLFWCEHKPSITVYVRPHEWMLVGAWVYANFDIMSGVSFLPHSEHTYRQAPYQEINEDAYKAALYAMPKDVDWSLISEYEKEDSTTGHKEFACTGNKCELV